MSHSHPILEIRDLHVEVNGKEVLRGVNMLIQQGEVHVLMGPNGCGKSTLMNTIMGMSQYKVTQGSIILKGHDITHLPINERAAIGLGLMHQKPPSVSGLELARLVKAAFKSEKYDEVVETTNMSKLMERDVNVGFSGGETKRSEVLQLLLQSPDLAMLDEPESGVDLENISLLGAACRALFNFTIVGNSCESERAGLIITHTGHIMDYVPASVGHVMVDGVIRCTGDPYRVHDIIQQHGYRFCEGCATHTAHQCSTCVCKCVTLNDGQRTERFMKALKSARLPLTPTVSTIATKGKVRLVMADESVPMSVTAQPSPQTKPMSVILSGDDDLTMPVTGGVVMKSDEKNKLQLEDVFDTASSGSFCQIDQNIREYYSKYPGLEVMPLKEALELPNFRDKYYWKAVNPNKDAVTKTVYDMEQAGGAVGYVLIAKEGVSIPEAVNCAVLLERQMEEYVDEKGEKKTRRKVQSLHNIIIAMQKSTLHVTSTCATCGGCDAVAVTADYTEDLSVGQHNGITEFYIEDDAHMSMTMIHRFGGDYLVFPRSAAVQGKNSVYHNNYVCLDPVRKVQMYPMVHMNGEGSLALFNSVLIANKGTVLDIGSAASLNAKNCKVEMVSRAISRGGRIVARGNIIGNAQDTHGHIECNGLLLGSGVIHALPEIQGCVEGTELSHEAAVGKLDRDKLDYLMSRGLTEDSAVGLIIRGFLDLKIPGLLPSLQKIINKVIEEAASGF